MRQFFSSEITFVDDQSIIIGLIIDPPPNEKIKKNWYYYRLEEVGKIGYMKSLSLL